MSTWLSVSVAVPLCLGVGPSFAVLRPEAADWHRRLRKPRYGVTHGALLPLVALVSVVGGIGAHLAASEAELARHTPELRAARVGQVGLGFYWLGLTFLALWPRLVALGPSLRLALADVAVGGLLQLVATVQFFRLTAAGGLLLLLCFSASAALAAWNAALVAAERESLPL
ncbi:hypothetical protein H4R18_003180 [Coemansia javaensis]|uniref:Uncharacterized protein n=1 Tax=Coemansia javaensis TaxID=2761396 RepID=A0A9W8HG93_9FUNG|nr:hypothetical protein H4R18_003180 [Coemansia javaensis]